MKTFIIILFSAILSSTWVYSQNYDIAVQITESKDKVAYLGHHFGPQRYLKDTSALDLEGNARFNKEKILEEGLYFYYTPNVYLEFIIDNNQEFSVTANATNIAKTIDIKGSELNTSLYKMQLYLAKMRKMSDEIRSSIDSTSTDKEKGIAQEKLKSQNKEVRAYQNKLKVKHKGTLLAKMINAMQSVEVPENNAVENVQLYRYHYITEHFWDSVNIADSGLLRTPLLNAKILEYLDKTVIQNPDSLIKAVDFILTKALENKEVFRFALVTLANKYETSPIMGLDKVFVHIAEKYYISDNADWVSEDVKNKLKERIASIKPNFIGNQAPAITLYDTLESPVKLYDIDARFTVLYFYDPDCGHCKKKTPVLNGLYPNLRAKNVEVLGINTTTDGVKWRKYVYNNDLQWINLADLSSKSYMKYYYDVRSTPTVFILDKDKKIIAKKIDVDNIEGFIDQYIIKEDKQAFQ